jgi:hypothetical protein
MVGRLTSPAVSFDVALPAILRSTATVAKVTGRNLSYRPNS